MRLLFKGLIAQTGHLLAMPATESGHPHPLLSRPVMKRILFFVSLLLVGNGAKAKLFINEVSQGTNGSQEYVEFVVAGSRSCSDSTMDLRGILFDDNAGWFGTGSFNAGSFRFAMHATWSQVPFGSIILVYNSADKNAAISLVDDPTDADNDHVYVVPDTSWVLEHNAAAPALASSLFDYSTATAGTWLTPATGAYAASLDLDDSADVFSIIYPTATVSGAHSIGWGNLGTPSGQSPLIQFASNATGSVLYNADSTPNTQIAWAMAPVVPGGVDNETPGYGNTATNSAWIDAMRSMVTGSLPAVPGAISGPATVCIGSSATYTISSVPGASSYKWILPAAWSGSSTDTSITVTVAHTGNIRVEAINACGTSVSNAELITAIVAPAIPSQIIGNSYPCPGATEVYSVPPSGATSLTWNIPSGWTATSSGDSLICVVGSSAGTIALDLTNFCGTNVSLTLPVSVGVNVTPAVSVAAANNTICAGASATFIATSVNGGLAPTYTWKLNGVSQAATGDNFTIRGLASGDSISVVLTSSEHCATTNDVVSSPVGVSVLPLVATGLTVSAAPGTAVCQGTAVSFATKTVGGGAKPGYMWFKNGAIIPGATASTYYTNTLNNGDVVYPVLISDAICPAMDTTAGSSIVFTVSPFVTPTVAISANRNSSNGAIRFNATYTGGGVNPGFQWLKNGIVIPSATSASYTTTGLKSTDSISVRLSSDEPCATSRTVVSKSIKVINVSATGVGSLDGNNALSLQVYPNPSTGSFVVVIEPRYEYAGKALQVEVINTLGQAVYSATPTMDGRQQLISIALPQGVAKGLYQVILRSSGFRKSTTVLVQ